MKLILRVQDAGGVEVSTREFGEGVYRIGRSDFCDLVLQGKEISRSHVELRVTPAAIYFTNMSGAGRLKLNGERVETGELKEGDSIGLGQYILQCQIDIHEALAPETPLESSPVMALENEEPAEALPSEEVPSEALPEPESMPVLVSEPAPFDNVREFPIFERQAENEVLEVEGALALKTENTAIEG
ncbi:FHA domain-containing protein, partial [bacterium]|nr:FHA domain-containing protein [bacterium]